MGPCKDLGMTSYPAFQVAKLISSNSFEKNVCHILTCGTTQIFLSLTLFLFVATAPGCMATEEDLQTVFIIATEVPHPLPRGGTDSTGSAS